MQYRMQSRLGSSICFANRGPTSDFRLSLHDDFAGNGNRSPFRLSRNHIERNDRFVAFLDLELVNFTTVSCASLDLRLILFARNVTNGNIMTMVKLLICGPFKL